MYDLKIARDTVEILRERLDIVEVVGEEVALRQRGRELIGLCPFHNEKTPSFTVSPEKGVFHCFGCQMGGDAITFAMEFHHQSFTEAAIALAQRYDIPLRTLDPEQQVQLERELTLKGQLHEIAAISREYFVAQLHSTPTALQYLKRRGLTDETIADFKLGYAPGGWDNLYQKLVFEKRLSASHLEQLGLIRQRRDRDGYYDIFRNRIIFPINDRQGRTIAFGGRSLGGESPKYINSCESPLFSKSKTLFALDRACQSISQADGAIVCEGFLDAIAYHQAGFTQAVAILGTAFSRDSAELAVKYSKSKRLLINFDSDEAGQKSTERAIAELSPLLYRSEIALRILTLPDAKDAGEFMVGNARQGNARQGNAHQESGAVELEKNTMLARCIEEAPFWIDWQLQDWTRGANLQEAESFQRVARSMVDLLEQLQDANLQSLYLERCAEILSGGDRGLFALRLDSLTRQIRTLQPIEFHPDKKKTRLPGKSRPLGTAARTYRAVEQPSTASPSSTAEWYAACEGKVIALYYYHPSLRPTIEALLERRDLFFGPMRSLWLSVNNSQASDNLDLVESEPALQKKPCGSFLTLTAQVHSAINLMQFFYLRDRISTVIAELSRLNPATDGEQFAFLSERLSQLQRAIANHSLFCDKHQETSLATSKTQ